MDHQLISRAIAAYFRSAARGGAVPDQPSTASYVAEHDGRSYVVLVNASRTLAVYRVRTDGVLKALRRWPAEVEAGT